jgi:Ca2+-binding RTX toxin-like protein
LVDPQTGQEFLVDTTTGLLQSLNPITNLLEDATIDVPENGERVLELVTTPGSAGPFNAVIEFLDEDTTTNTILETVTVTGTAQNCTVRGTSGDDPLLTDTPGDDVICGFEGNHTITAPNGGDDVVIGGPGNDTIIIKDEVKKNDLANGGSGKDSCQKDKKDKTVKCGSAKKPK